MTGKQSGHSHGDSGSPEGLQIIAPTVSDGAAVWRLTRDSGVLDLNSSYAYLLWCRDFAETSVVAKENGTVVGFVTGYLRPDASDTVVVWQVAVDESVRGRGVAAKLIDHLLDKLAGRGVRYLETTITSDNVASIKLFSAVARQREAELVRSALFTDDLFPDAHEGEDLYRIGPLVGVGVPVP